MPIWTNKRLDMKGNQNSINSYRHLGKIVLIGLYGFIETLPKLKFYINIYNSFVYFRFSRISALFWRRHL